VVVWLGVLIVRGDFDRRNDDPWSWAATVDGYHGCEDGDRTHEVGEAGCDDSDPL
jgi:hypothetical protein